MSLKHIVAISLLSIAGLRQVASLRWARLPIVHRPWNLLQPLQASTFDDKRKVEQFKGESDGRLRRGGNETRSSTSAARGAASVGNEYDGGVTFDDNWDGYMDGFDWQLEQARRLLEGPSFTPLRMTFWQPPTVPPKRQAPGLLDQTKILLSNALQIAGMTESMDGAPMVQGVNTFKGSFLQLLSRVADGNLQELAGGPLFLLLWDYFRKYGPVFKLAFGPKSFIVVSDPTMVKHILKDNPNNYDKGILAEILEPVMGKGLIPADPETWKVRRRAIVPGFHKAWLNAMVRPCVSLPFSCHHPFFPLLHLFAPIFIAPHISFLLTLSSP